MAAPLNSPLHSPLRSPLRSPFASKWEDAGDAEPQLTPRQFMVGSMFLNATGTARQYIAGVGYINEVA